MLQKEVTMKKLLLIALALSFPVMANAAISVDQAVNPAVLRNNGFSADTANIVNVGKARANGVEYYTPEEVKFQKQNKFVRFWRKLYMYTDPASEDYSFYHHDSSPVPKYNDL